VADFALVDVSDFESRVTALKSGITAVATINADTAINAGIVYNRVQAIGLLAERAMAGVSSPVVPEIPVGGNQTKEAMPMMERAVVAMEKAAQAIEGISKQSGMLQKGKMYGMPKRSKSEDDTWWKKLRTAMGDLSKSIFNRGVQSEFSTYLGNALLGPLYGVLNEVIDFDSLKDKIADGFEEFKTSETFAKISEGVTKLRDKMRDGFASMKDGILSMSARMSSVTENMSKNLHEFSLNFLRKFDSWMEVLKDTWQDMRDASGSWIGKMLGGLGGWLKPLQMLLMTKFQWLGGLMKQGSLGLGAKLVGLGKTLSTGVAGAFGTKAGLMATGKFAVTKAGPALYLANVLLQGVIGAVKAQDKSFKGRMAGLLGGMISGATFGIAKREKLEKELGYIFSNMKDLGRGFVIIMKEAWDKIKNGFSFVWNGIKSRVEGLKEIFSFVFEGVKNMAMSMVDTVKSFIQKRLGEVISIGTRLVNMFKSLIDPVKEIFSAIADFVKNNPVTKGAQNIFNWLKGKNVAEPEPLSIPVIEDNLTPKVNTMVEDAAATSIYPEKKLAEETSIWTKQLIEKEKAEPTVITVPVQQQGTLEQAGMNIDNLGLVLISAGKL